MAKILVIAEHRNGILSEGTLELCRIAKELAPGLGAEAVAAVFAKDDSIANEVAKYIPEVFLVTDPAVEVYTADGFTQAAKAVLDAQDIKGVLLAQTYDGVDLAGKIAMAMDAGIVSNCNKISADGGNLLFTRNTYNGKIQEEKKVLTDKFVASFEKGAYDVAEESGAGTVTAVSASFGEIRTNVKEIIETMSGSVDIATAKVIVSGGRGCKDGDKYKEVILPLAAKLGGEYAGSRPVIDSGWIDAARQVGQSAKVVKPDLYIAAGISGSIQHVAGMKGSQCIVAINKDPEAPIFNLATYGIVGDLFEVIPAMMENL